MNRDAEIADSMLTGHLGLALIALSGVYFGISYDIIANKIGNPWYAYAIEVALLAVGAYLLIRAKGRLARL